MILSSPAPQFGQRCMSMPNTRLSSLAQLMRAGPPWAVSASHWAPDAATPGTSSYQGERNAMINEALQLRADDIGHIPLHQQTVSWGMKERIDAYQCADGFMLFKWMNVR
jgi:hypothetical protein